MNTDNKKASYEHYITLWQKIARDALLAFYVAFFITGGIAIYQNKVEGATLCILLGYIIRQYHREYECYIESEACFKEWDVERENEKAAKEFAKQMEEAKAIEAKYKESQQKSGDVVTATIKNDTSLWYGYVDSSSMKPIKSSDFKEFKPEPVPTPAKPKKKPSKKKKNG